ncbi:30S ribosomal protein S1, putative [Babesia ovis]|uniref:30S ribosomal protein S1, putative n=1 Tax=Babesia ovis TaxID=5869 RepID=A0A9W5T8J8_BABOV|nr:30S ribosomal protein S1, putative [Babesia ovis]
MTYPAFLPNRGWMELLSKVWLCIWTLCVMCPGATSVSTSTLGTNRDHFVPQGRSLPLYSRYRVAYIGNVPIRRNVGHVTVGVKREIELKAGNADSSYPDGGIFTGFTGRRKFYSRSEKRRLGKMGQEFWQVKPERAPWVTEDFGGVPNLPLKTPINLNRGPVDEEFLEMRKRDIPHSMLKDYYMRRGVKSDEYMDYNTRFHPLFLRSPEDKRIYILGQGIGARPDIELDADDEYDYRSERYMGPGIGNYQPKRKKSRGLKYDLSFLNRNIKWDEKDDPDIEMDEHVRRARETWNSYLGKDRACQLMLSTLKDYNDANLSPIEPEPIPEGLEVIDPMFDRCFVPDLDGSPMWLNDWDNEYMRGKKELEGHKLAAYDDMWYERLGKLSERYHTFVLAEDTIPNIMKYFEEMDPEDVSKGQPGAGSRGPLRVVIGDKVLKTKWSENIPPIMLELAMKYWYMDRLKQVNEKQRRQRLLDMKADSFRSCAHMAMNRLIRERILRKEEKNRLEYIRFLRQRRKEIHKGRIAQQPKLPYWLWEECWKRRDSIVQDTFVEILKSVRAVEPDVDVAELTKGTLEQMKYPQLRGTKFDKQLMLDNTLANNVDRFESYIKKHGHGVEKMEEAPTGSSSGTQMAQDKHSGVYDDGKQGFNDEQIDGVPLPLPLGYYFRNVLSFDNFEKAFERFNLECFGRKEFGVRVGQWVKGRVEDVKPKRLLVDVHTSKLAVMRLSDFYKSPSEVLSGGFTNVFKEGDEMYFEVISKHGNDIRVSTRRIQEMYRNRDIYRKHFKDEIFKVRAIQRYTRGLLVQYQGDDVEDIKGYKCPYNTSELENLAFIPYEQLDKRYRCDVQLIKLDVVGKVLPVFISEWVLCNGIPLVSNIEALRRLPLGHIRPGDIVRAKQCMYGKHGVWLDLGHTIGTLSVMDMNPDDYEKHKVGDRRMITAEVKAVNMGAGFVELSTKELHTSTKVTAVNEWVERMYRDPDPVGTFNNKLKQEIASPEEVKGPGTVETNRGDNPLDNMPTMIISPSSRPTLPRMKPEEGNSTSSIPIKWDFTPTAPNHSPEDEVYHAYNQYRWEVLTEQGWDIVSPEEQRILNLAKFQNDEVVYYKVGGRSYRVDLVDMIRQNLTDVIEESLRNNCMVPLEESEVKRSIGLITQDVDTGLL